MQQNKKYGSSSKDELSLSKREKNAILIGLALIIFVLILTLFRSLDFSKKNSLEKTNASSQTKSLDYITVSPAILQQKILKKEKLVLLDVRDFDAYIKEHILDSLNAPAGEISTSVKTDNKDYTVIIGENADDENIPIAAVKLKEKGFQSVVVLAGGLLAWNRNAGQTISFGDPTSFLDQAKVTLIDLDKAQEIVNNGGKLFILDIRDPAVFSQGHVANATNIPLFELEKRRNEIPSYRQVIIFGANEIQQFQAGVQIYDMFMTSPFVVKGTIEQWQDKGFPLTK